jgi:hypothetical protein
MMQMRQQPKSADQWDGLSTQLNITDRVQFRSPSPLEKRTGTVVSISRDCSGLLYFIELDGEPYRIGDRLLQVVDCHRAGLRKIATIDEGEAALVAWRKTSAKRIDNAVKLLNPKSRERCADDVETAMIEVEYEHRQLLSGFEPNKFAKKAVKKLRPALRRVEVLMKDKALPTEFFFLRKGITEVLEHCEKISALPPAKNPRKEAELKRLAIRKAADLMKHSPLKLGHGAHADPAWRKIFVDLATILYGREGVNLTSQCLAYIRECRKAK